MQRLSPHLDTNTHTDTQTDRLYLYIYRYISTNNVTTNMAWRRRWNEVPGFCHSPITKMYLIYVNESIYTNLKFDKYKIYVVH